MPLYEYKCLNCEKLHEVVQKFSDAPLTQCPECGGEVSKMVSLSSFALKGSGWYTSDYKRSSTQTEPQPDAQKQPGSESKPASSPDNKSTDSKPKESKPADSKSTDSKPSTPPVAS